MPFIGEGEKRANAEGWLRDSRYYFKEMLNKNPEFFSKYNVDCISKGRAPYCDEVFVSHFPNYEIFLGNKLIHHHVGRDGQAVAIPEDIHIGQGGVHLIEGKIGVDANALEFSERVSHDFKNGLEFTWDNATKYIDRSKEYQSKNVDNEMQRKEQTTKEYAEEYNVNEQPNKQRTLKEKKKPLNKVIEAYNNIPSPVKTIISVGARIVIVGTVEIMATRVIGKSNKNSGGKTEIRKVKVVETVTETPVKGTKKSPHNRRGFSRTLDNGKIVPVKPTRVHKEQD